MLWIRKYEKERFRLKPVLKRSGNINHSSVFAEINHSYGEQSLCTDNSHYSWISITLHGDQSYITEKHHLWRIVYVTGDQSFFTNIHHTLRRSIILHLYLSLFPWIDDSPRRSITLQGDILPLFTETYITLQVRVKINISIYGA